MGDCHFWCSSIDLSETRWTPTDKWSNKWSCTSGERSSSIFEPYLVELRGVLAEPTRVEARPTLRDLRSNQRSNKWSCTSGERSSSIFEPYLVELRGVLAEPTRVEARPTLRDLRSNQ